MSGGGERRAVNQGTPDHPDSLDTKGKHQSLQDATSQGRGHHLYLGPGVHFGKPSVLLSEIPVPIDQKPPLQNLWANSTQHTKYGLRG